MDAASEQNIIRLWNRRDKEEILVADVTLGDARRARNWNAFNQVLRDRRSDLYGEMLGSNIKRGWY